MKRTLSQDADYILDLLVAAGHVSRETAFQARDIALDLAPGRTQNQINELAEPLRNAGVKGAGYQVSCGQTPMDGNEP
jgi:hypothetical protein